MYKATKNRDGIRNANINSPGKQKAANQIKC